MSFPTANSSDNTFEQENNVDTQVSTGAADQKPDLVGASYNEGVHAIVEQQSTSAFRSHFQGMYYEEEEAEGEETYVFELKGPDGIVMNTFHSLPYEMQQSILLLMRNNKLNLKGAIAALTPKTPGVGKEFAYSPEEFHEAEPTLQQIVAMLKD